ncbi:siderophore-interacting protein [Saccharomonospora marina XMU15]|uniref:Siderophore-interacting protein n=1 Tax=Saccharomonospora marina XMU15 TaxID=882083 RepID=H5X851_9PSEU|nr:siderophore-interacting protein [Saccharomonospora marina]EHR53583.1 siderophore-interacting protein [Saccharomonospora marina XMU15]
MTSTADLAKVSPFRLFDVEVLRRQRLSPTFQRITMTGPDLGRFADNGFDQRIKVILPLPGVGFDHLSRGDDWYQHWRTLPDQLRNPIRTYTVRAARPEANEIDVDFALHGETGPASRWATEARPGDRVAIVGPDAAYSGTHGGVDFRPHSGARRILLAGDETATPAIACILECLPGDATGEVLLEVPHAADALALTHPRGMRVTWLGRDGAAHGSKLAPALRDLAAGLLVEQERRTGQPVDDVDVDSGLLWEVPDGDPATRGLYAWLAGEAGVIKALRRYLVSDLGIDRRSVAFMGYWRLGRSEPTT